MGAVSSTSICAFSISLQSREAIAKWLYFGQCLKLTPSPYAVCVVVLRCSEAYGMSDERKQHIIEDAKWRQLFQATSYMIQISHRHCHVA